MFCVKCKPQDFKPDIIAAVSQATQTANRQIARAAGTVMAAFVLSNLAGLVRQILISQAFGTRPELDAFYAASTYPDVIFTLVAGGALASAFIPAFTGLLEQGARPAAWRLASQIANLVFAILAVLSLLSAWQAPWIVRLVLAPDFSPAQQALTASLLRILLISPAIFGVSGLLMGILNAHQVFLLPALAPTMYWLGMIFGVLFLSPALGVFGLAWGAVLGAALHLAIQAPGLLRLAERAYTASFGLASSDVRRVITLMGPRLIGAAVVQLNFVVNVILASGQPAGSLSAIKIAWAVMTMPQVVIAQAIAIAALPTFSAQAARGALDEMRSSLAATLRGVLLLSLPASVGLILLRQPLTAALFQRGEFDARSTDLVAWALLWYSAGLVGHSLVEVIARAFYAVQDTRTPVAVGTAAMSLNVLFSVAFAWLFGRWGWPPHGGLALANSLATALEAAGLLALMSRRLGGLEGRRILNGGLQSAAACAAMGVCVWGVSALAAPLPVIWAAALAVLAGGLAYGLAILALGAPEARQLLALYAQRK